MAYEILREQHGKWTNISEWFEAGALEGANSFETLDLAKAAMQLLNGLWPTARLQIAEITPAVTRAGTIQYLEALSSGDPEFSHADADYALVKYLRALGETEVADAYMAARDRVGFWYA